MKFWFFDHFIVDKGSGPLESLKKSSAITRGAKWDMFYFFILVAFILQRRALVYRICVISVR